MAEQRLIDANKEVIRAYEDIPEPYSDALIRFLRDCETIDSETLPVVQQLRAELAEVKAERDALRQKKSYATSKFGNNSLTLYRHDEKELSKSKRVLMVEYKGLDCSVSFSESGEEGPFTSVMNIDRYGHLTIAKEFANAILGPCESEMKVVKND